MGCSAHAHTPRAIPDAVVYISLIHRELPHATAGPAGDPNPSAAGAGGPAGHPRDVQKALDACVWAMEDTEIQMC